MSNNWKSIKIKDVANINVETYSSKENWDFVNYLDTSNITENKIDEIKFIDLTKEKLPSRAKRKIQEFSILFSTVRPDQKHYGIIKESVENFLVSTAFVVINADKTKSDPYFLYYLLIQDEIIEFLSMIAEQSTSAYPSIKSSDIGDLEFLVPPLKEQQKISKILSSLDEKIEINRKINENLEEQAKEIFLENFVRNEKNYTNWEKVSLIDIANYLNGLAMQKYRPKENEESLPVLKIKELRQGVTDKSSELCSCNIDSNYIINNGDIIFSWSGSLLVDIWCGGTCGLNQHLFKVTSDKYEKWFYYLWTKYHLDEFILIAKDKATTMGHIKRENLKNAQVLIPSDEEYKKLTLILKPMIDLIIDIKIQIQKLSSIRDELLPKLMTGEIDVSKIDI